MVKIAPMALVVSAVAALAVSTPQTPFLADDWPFSGPQSAPFGPKTAVCPLAEIVRPQNPISNDTLRLIVADEAFRNASAEKLVGAVRIRTEVQDDSPTVAEDPEFWRLRFEPLHKYLEKTFPVAYSFLEVEKVNLWGLVLTWKGSNESLKPLLLAAHQDVVPAKDDALGWTYPPFAGVYYGDRVWGRGSSDCKNLLVGLLEAAEALHNDGFRPQRTIVYAFGFDEEIGGDRGAAFIAEHLLHRYGENAFYAVFDEGGQGLVEENGVFLALPGTTEKGLMDVSVGLHTPGGHSSVPPPHTGIGVLAQVAVELEKHPFEGVLTPRNPTFHEYQCVAAHLDSLDDEVRRALLDAEKDSNANKKAIKFLQEKSGTSRALIGTTLALDIIQGGIKTNALPEYSELVVNHRVAVESSTNATVEADLHHITTVADQYDLGVVFEGTEIRRKSAKGWFEVKVLSRLEPAPSTPIGDLPWKILAGTLRHVYEEAFYGGTDYLRGQPVVVAPGIATGNTDTAHYWALSKRIFRYRPGIAPTVETHAHGIDERLPFDLHLQVVAFYYQYLQTVDGTTDDVSDSITLT